MVFPKDLHQFLFINFRGFGFRKDAEILWQWFVFAVLWCQWLERNTRIFKGIASSSETFAIGLLFWHIMVFCPWIL